MCSCIHVLLYWETFFLSGENLAYKYLEEWLESSENKQTNKKNKINLWKYVIYDYQIYGSNYKQVYLRCSRLVLLKNHDQNYSIFLSYHLLWEVI